MKSQTYFLAFSCSLWTRDHSTETWKESTNRIFIAACRKNNFVFQVLSLNLCSGWWLVFPSRVESWRTFCYSSFTSFPFINPKWAQDHQSHVLAAAGFLSFWSHFPSNSQEPHSCNSGFKAADILFLFLNESWACSQCNAVYGNWVLIRWRQRQRIGFKLIHGSALFLFASCDRPWELVSEIPQVNVTYKLWSRFSFAGAWKQWISLSFCSITWNRKQLISRTPQLHLSYLISHLIVET